MPLSGKVYHGSKSLNGVPWPDIPTQDPAASGQTSVLALSSLSPLVLEEALGCGISPALLQTTAPLAVWGKQTWSLPAP